MPKTRKVLSDWNAPYIQSLMRLIETQSKTTLANWAVDYAEKVILPLWSSYYPEDARPQNAIDAARGWLSGAIKLTQAKPVILECHAAARDAEGTPVAQAAARSIGQCASTIHSAQHCIGLAFYGALAIAYDELGADAPWEQIEQCAATECGRMEDALRAVAAPNHTRRIIMSDLRDENKPTVVVSRCLGFCRCRYNGDVLTSSFVEKLKEHVNYITVCPEVDIGLGVPRNPVRLVMDNENVELYQPANDKVYTKEMGHYAEEFFGSAGQIHGFILKGRSPSCGIKDVKIYGNREKSAGSILGVGLFASYAYKLYPNLPIEEEGRLTNYAIREHFLTKLYTSYRFQKVKNSDSMKDLIKFHADHKYLLLAYNQNQSKILGKIVANHDKKSFKDITDEYERHLGLAFARLPGRNNYINTFMHIFGYFSDDLNSREKAFMLDRFQKFRDDKIHISVVLNLLRTYAIKYNQEYLLDQVIWEAYPEELLDISDSGK